MRDIGKELMQDLERQLVRQRAWIKKYKIGLGDVAAPQPKQVRQNNGTSRKNT